LKRIGIISPLLPEAACLIARPPRPGALVSINPHISLLICGMGAERAANAAQEMVYSGIELLISWGTAGALSANLQAGDLLVPEAVVTRENRRYQADKEIRSKILARLGDCPCDIYLGALADTPRVLTDRGEKEALHTRFKALGVDMETAAIARIAEQHAIPFIAIRAIADSVSTIIPDVVIKTTNVYGEARLIQLIAGLIKNPRQIPQLNELAAGFRAAAKTLKWIGSRIEQILQI
jgi:adenosylhomocysteine nucleosidase